MSKRTLRDGGLVRGDWESRSPWRDRWEDGLRALENLESYVRWSGRPSRVETLAPHDDSVPQSA